MGDDDGRLTVVQEPLQFRVAGRRLRETAERYGLPWEATAPRVVPAAGDLTRPHLGLTPERYDALARSVDAVHHCGAPVDLALPYAEVAAASVGGTEEVLRLAARHRAVPVHHVSTVGVFSGGHLLGSPVTQREPLTPAGGLRHGYTRSKWAAERLVEQARGRGLPVTVYRPTRISGDHRTGACHSAHRQGLPAPHRLLHPDGFPPGAGPGPRTGRSRGCAAGGDVTSPAGDLRAGGCGGRLPVLTPGRDGARRCGGAAGSRSGATRGGVRRVRSERETVQSLAVAANGPSVLPMVVEAVVGLTGLVAGLALAFDVRSVATRLTERQRRRSENAWAGVHPLGTPRVSLNTPARARFRGAVMAAAGTVGLLALSLQLHVW